MTKSKRMLLLPVMAGAGLLLFGACVGGPPQPIYAQAAATATPTLVPVSTPTQLDAVSTPTPTPVAPSVAQADAEDAVLSAVSTCTTSVAQGTGGPGTLRLIFNSTYSTDTNSWKVEVDTSDFAVTFGTWQVGDSSPQEAQPVDTVAQQIADGNLQCQYPAVLLEANPAPPDFVNPGLPTNSTTGKPMAIDSDLHAAMRVWTGVYDCSQDFPELSSFTATGYVNGTWVVEGRTKQTSYGLWQVDGYTGDVKPLDDHAKAIVASCGATPIVMTANQASIRVWVATYDCYTTPPTLDAFTAQQDSSSRWVVEGREMVTDPATGVRTEKTLGLWLVQTDSGDITGLDALARNMRAQACFQTFK